MASFNPFRLLLVAAATGLIVQPAQAQITLTSAANAPVAGKCM